MIPSQIEIGPIVVHPYGFLIAVAIFLGWYIAKKRATLYKIPKSIFEDYILLLPLTTSLIGARLYHVLDYRYVYSQNPVSIFYIQNGGLGIWGGLVGFLIGLYIVTKVKKLNLLNILDLVAPSFALAQAIGRVGNWINQEGFGPPTSLPWAVYIDPKNRPLEFANATRFHPTFFYESILDLLIFILLLYLSKKLKQKGQIFAFYLILYSSARFALEFLRIDTWVAGGIKIAQLFCAIGVITGFLIVFLQNRNIVKESGTDK